MSASAAGYAEPIRFQITTPVRTSSNSSQVLCPFSSESFNFLFTLSLVKADFTGGVLNHNSIVAQWLDVHTAGGKSGAPKEEWHDMPTTSAVKALPTVVHKGSPNSDPAATASVQWDHDAMATAQISKTLTPNGYRQFAEQKIAVCFFGASKKGNKDVSSPLGRVCINLSDFASRAMSTFPFSSVKIDPDNSVCATEVVEIEEELFPAAGSVKNIRLRFQIISKRVHPKSHSRRDTTQPEEHTSVLSKLESMTTVKHFPRTCNFIVRLLNRGSAPGVDFPASVVGLRARICSSPFNVLCIGSYLELQYTDEGCFGIVQGCLLTTDEHNFQLSLQIAENLVYLPGEPRIIHALSNLCSKVMIVYHTESKDLKDEIASRKRKALDVSFILQSIIRNAFNEIDASIARKNVEAMETLKTKSLARALGCFHLDSEELCMVYLRQGFLMSQQLISHIIQPESVLMTKLFPGYAYEKCISLFGSKNGPWDIFSIFTFLNRPEARDALASLSFPDKHFVEVDRDDKRLRLEEIISDIFIARNMWAHVGASDADCRNALQAIIRFIKELPSQLLPSADDFNIEQLLADLACIIDKMSKYSHVKLSIDNVSYCIFLRSIRKLTSICTKLLRQFPHAEISKELERQLIEKNNSALTEQRRQSNQLEVKEVTLAILGLKKKFDKKFDIKQLELDCKIIRTARNALAHATLDSNRVILILVSLGSVVRLVEFLDQNCLHRESPSEKRAQLIDEMQRVAESVKLDQAEFFQRCSKTLQTDSDTNPLDLDNLFDSITRSHSKEVKECPFFPFLELNSDGLSNSHDDVGQSFHAAALRLKSAMNFRKMQLIFGRNIVGNSEFSTAVKSMRKALGFDKVDSDCDQSSNASDHFKHCRSVIGLIARVPPAERSTVETAVDWILSHKISCGFLQACGLNLIAQDFVNLQGKPHGTELKPEFKGIFSQSLMQDPDVSSKSLESDVKKFLQELCTTFRLEQQHLMALRSAERNYDSACLISQTFSGLEELYTSTVRDAFESTKWRNRCLFFEGMLKNADIDIKMSQKLLALKNLAYVAHDASEKHSAQLKVFESFFGSAQTEKMDLAKTYMIRLILKAGSDLRCAKDCKVDVCNGNNWQAILDAQSLVFNSNELMHFHCLPEPDSYFKFDRSVVPSKNGEDRPMPDFFVSCVKSLQPVLAFSQLPASADKIEVALGTNLYDTLSNLAALSSMVLYPLIQNVAKESQVPVIVKTVNFGMNATVNSTGLMVGRHHERLKLCAFIRPVFEISSGAGQDSNHCPIVLLRGIPGTGKSSLAARELEKLQKEFDRNTDVPVYRHIIHGRGAQAVRDGLLKMGLALAHDLNIDSDAPVQEVLGSLKVFLMRQRFVIFADDIDKDGTLELLKHIHKSSNPCALILTSQFENVFNFLLGSALDGIDSFRFSENSNIQLNSFQPAESLQLVERVCLGQASNANIEKCDYIAIFKIALLKNPQATNWLCEILDKDFGHLPIAVHVFSNWFHHQVKLAIEQISSIRFRCKRPVRKSSKVGFDFDGWVDDVKRKWSDALVQEQNPVMEDSAARGFRGLSATVRLWLHGIQKFVEDDRNDAICFLKIMCFSDPNDINIWSIFEPELPFLFVPSTLASTLPQLHLKKNFSVIKKRINESLQRGPQTRIPLLESLIKMGWFGIFLDQLIEVAPVLQVRSSHTRSQMSLPSSPGASSQDTLSARVHHGMPDVITMHQLIQQAILSQLGSTQPELDLILLELLESRIYTEKSIHPVLNTYYFDIAHTAKTILHNFEDHLLKIESYNSSNAAAVESHQCSLYTSIKNHIQKRRIRLRIGQHSQHSSQLAGLFKKLDLEDESFELVSEILNPKSFPEISLETFNLVADRQRTFCSSIEECEYQWLYPLRKMKVGSVHLFSTEKEENILIKTSTLCTFVPPKEERLLYLLDEISKILDDIQRRTEDDLDGSKKRKSSIWLEKQLIHNNFVKLVLKESGIYGDRLIHSRAQDLSQRIYRDLNTPSHLQSRRSRNSWEDLDEGTKSLLKVKKLISKQLYDADKRRPFDFRPLRHSMDVYDFSRNYICRDLAESCLQLALLLSLPDRHEILENAIFWAHESERCSNATKADGNVNVAYRKQLLARCYGACGKFEKSLFYHSLALIGLREYHDRHLSRTSRDWLDDIQCCISATLRQMQSVCQFSPGDSAVLQYLRWLECGFGNCEHECSEKQRSQLRCLDPFDVKYYLDRSDFQCCHKNFEGLIGPRQPLEEDFRKKLILHHEIHIMLLLRRLQGGFFVRHQDLDERKFAEFEIEQRRKIFEFFMVSKQLDSDPSIFASVPEVYPLFWQMMLSDFSAPADCMVSIGDGRNTFKVVPEWQDLEPTQDNFDRVALNFENFLSDEHRRRTFFRCTFANIQQSYALRMLKYPTFDQRVEIIQRMETEHPDIKANQQMLRILFQTRDIKHRSIQALDFICRTRRDVWDFDVLGNLLRICADCNDDRRLMIFWNMGKKVKNRCWPSPDVTEQLDACFHSIKCPNRSWKQLHNLMKPSPAPAAAPESGRGGGSRLKSGTQTPPPSSS